MSDNRRKGQERLPAEVKVDYRTVGSFITDYTKNISRGGVFIRTSMPLDIGSKIRLRITLPDGDAPFALDGIVKWISHVKDKDSHPPGMGVEFIDFSEEIKAKIDRLVATYRGDG